MFASWCKSRTVLCLYTDGNKEIEEEYDPGPKAGGACDFDELLRRAKASIRS